MPAIDHTGNSGGKSLAGMVWVHLQIGISQDGSRGIPAQYNLDRLEAAL